MSIKDLEYSLFVLNNKSTRLQQKSQINKNIGKKMWIKPVSYTHLDVYKRQL